MVLNKRFRCQLPLAAVGSVKNSKPVLDQDQQSPSTSEQRFWIEELEPLASLALVILILQQFCLVTDTAAQLACSTVSL